MNAPAPSSIFHTRWFALAWVAFGIAWSTYTALCVAVNENHHEDLLIYSSGAALGISRESPYDTERVRDRVAKQYPGEYVLIDNCGFFLTPQAILEFAPILPLDWKPAKIIWCLATVGWGAAAGWFLLTAFEKRSVPRWLCGVVAFAVLCNPMSLFALVIGQTSIFLLGCIVLGQMAQRNKRHRLGEFLWALAFIKPHLALPMLLLAWYDGGISRPVGILIWVFGLNVYASLVAGKPLLMLEYVQYLGEVHGTIRYNDIAANPHISSWNRLMIALGGPTVELGAFGTVASYAVWFSLCAVRFAVMRCRPGIEWVLAAVSCGIPLCCQALPYELPILCLILPWVVASFLSGARLAPVLALVFAAMAMQLGGDGSSFDQLAKLSGSALIGRLMESHQSLCIAALAAVVLIAGSHRVTPSASETCPAPAPSTASRPLPPE